MRSIKRVTSLVVTIMFITVLFVSQVAFAAEEGGTGSSTGSLNLVSSVPKEGSEKMPVENVGIKLYFDGNVTAAEVWEINKNSFELRDSNNKKVNVLVYKGKEPGYILVTADPEPVKENQPGRLEPKSDYSLVIKDTLKDTDGNTLGEEKTVNFRTLDIDGNSRISMYMMVGLVILMVVIMILTNYRKMKAEVEAKALEQANPYKIAKERGITVDEAKVLIEKARERNRKKLEKAGVNPNKPKQLEKAESKQVEAPKKKVYKVKGPKPISEAGGTYKSGRKAEAERKAKAEAAKKAAKASTQNKGASSKGKKGKGNKKK